jgi:hypothetical protein
MSDKKFYTGKSKLSKENAEKAFEKILTKYEIAEFEKEDADVFINKIMFGKLYLNEKDELIYILSKSIDQGNGLANKFKIINPEQAFFTDNDIDLMAILMAYESKQINSIEKNSMAKLACIFLGLQPDFANKLTIKDAIGIFMIGLNLFFGS